MDRDRELCTKAAVSWVLGFIFGKSSIGTPLKRSRRAQVKSVPVPHLPGATRADVRDIRVSLVTRKA